MKRYIACLLLLSMLFIATTGCSTSTDDDAPAKEDIHESLKVVFNEICSVYDDCRELAGAFSEHDIGGKWFKACFEDYDVNKKIYNDNFKNWVTGNRQLISSIPDDMEAANNHLKEYSDYSDDDYYTAIKDLCLAVESYANLLTSWPTGYSEFTYWEKANDLSAQITTLISAAEFVE